MGAEDTFVVRVLELEAEFRMGEATAKDVMLAAHRLGACVVAVSTKEVAEEKATRPTDMARREGHPLTFTTEPESGRWEAAELRPRAADRLRVALGAASRLSSPCCDARPPALFAATR